MKKLLLIISAFLLILSLFSFKNWTERPRKVANSEYILIESSTPHQLAMTINSRLQQGYKLQGGVSSIGSHYIQAMVSN
jgi:hypothetical protein